MALRWFANFVCSGALVALAACACAPGTAAAASIRKWVDAKGVTHYSNVPGDGAKSARPATVTGVKPGGSRSSIFKFTDGAGVTHYTDERPRNRQFVVISVYCPACDPRSPVDWNATRLNLTDYVAEINQNAATWGVDPALVRAIVHAESAFNPQAESHKGAQGLMQLMPATAAQYGITDSFDAASNLRGGVQHLAGLLKAFNGDERLAAAAYNAGEGAVRKYNGVPPYAETEVYVDRVAVLRQRYRTDLALATATPSM
jgi:hypothetical protein